MHFSLRLTLLLLFVAFPLIELAILIKAGETIGFWPTIGLLVAAAALGLVVIRARGVSIVARMFAATGEGRTPFEPMLDSYAVITAGFLLILPGFLTDAIALLLLVPPIRRMLLRRVWPGLVRGPVAVRRGPGYAEWRWGSQRRGKDGMVIDTTYERIDDARDKDPSP